MKIAIIGGGPAGLYFARLMKLHDRRHDIHVVEQNAQDATYGFGIALGSVARERIKDTDPELFRRLEGSLFFDNRQDICLNGNCVEVEYSTTSGAIERLELLQLLLQACREAGVRVTHGCRIDSLAEFADCDLVVGADGVNSRVRQLHENAFGVSRYRLTNFLAWYGVDAALDKNGLSFRKVPEGYFVGHYYTCSRRMSTFVAECDAATWHEAGIERMPEQERRRLIERIFVSELGGRQLVDNKSAFRNLVICTNRNWVHRNVVLIGDAMWTAHPSIGSGTRLAMEDAQALFESFLGPSADVPSALARFEEARRPGRARFGQAAECSYLWYENLRRVMQQPAIEFAYDFLTRTGRVDDRRLRTYAPAFYERYQQYRLSKSA